MIAFDLKLDDSGDIIFLDGPDIATVTGAELVAQDIKRQLEMPLGALSWDNTAGSNIFDSINDNVSSNLVEQEMVRIARADMRIDQESIKVVIDAEQNPVLQFTVLDDSKVQEVKV